MTPEEAELYATIGKLEGCLEYIRDLARTGTAPMASNMTPQEWNTHRLNFIAGRANAILEETKEVTNGR